MALEFGAFRDEITKYDTFRYMGKIEKIVGMTIEASGPAAISAMSAAFTRRT